MTYFNTPVGKLHAEILDLIFEFACPRERFIFNTLGKIVLNGVFRISHVCHVWRQRVASSPKLWTNLAFFSVSNNKLPDLLFLVDSINLAPLNFVLGMSKELPLTLVLWIYPSDYPSRNCLTLNHALCVYLKPIIAHISRWRDLTLDVRIAMHLPEAPNLRSLGIIECEAVDMEARKSLNDFIRHKAPKLRKLDFTRSVLGKGIPFPIQNHLPFTQLDTLSGVFSIDWVAKGAPFLVQLRTLDLRDLEDVENSTLAVELPLLQTLRLADTKAFLKILSLLTVPSLREIDLLYPPLPPHQVATAFQDFLSRSSPPIRVLRLTGVHGCPVLDTPLLLSLFPHLEYLDWVDPERSYSDSIALLKFLCATSPCSEIPGKVKFRNLPDLHSLRVTISTAFSDSELLNVLEMRTDRNSSRATVLRDIEIDLRSDTWKVTWHQDRWERLKQRGVLLKVRSNHLGPLPR